MSYGQPHQQLYDNLLILHELSPGSSDFQKCIKEDMFNKPNRNAFDQVINYLCRTYDSVRYLPKIPWPFLDRDQERTFRQNTVAFMKEIILQKPEARIPPFSPSFLSTPGGDRLIKFMWKFSLLVLKTVVERESDEPVLDYPTTGKHLIDALTEMNLEELRKGIDEFCGLLIDANTYADKLKYDLKKQSEELKSQQSEIKSLVQSLDFLSEPEKALMLSGDCHQYEPVIQKWSDIFNSKLDEATNKFKSIEIQSSTIKDCYESVKTLVDSKNMPVVLDGSKYPSNLKDCNGNLDIADIIFQASKAASSIRKSISSSGGLQTLDAVLPFIESMNAQLQSVASSLSETKAGYVNLLSASSRNTSSTTTANGILPIKGGTPTLKGSLKLGYELLQDAQMSTPPMVFNVNCDLPSKCSISAESPPIEALMGTAKSLGETRKAATSFTPKTSKSAKQLDVSSSFMRGKASRRAAFNNSITNNVVQTPALFGQTRPATSTVCKPTSSLNCSKGSALSSSITKFESFQGPGIKSLSQTDFFCSENVKACKKRVDLTDDISDDAIKREEPTLGAVQKEKDFNSENVGKAKPNGLESSAVVTQSSLDIPTRSLHQIAISSSLNQSRQVAVKPLSKPQDVKEKPTYQAEATSSENPLEGSHINAVIPKEVVPHLPNETMFDSPHSSVGIFSPVSENNSFFNDSHSDERTTAACVPKLDFDFEDEISPSGRVSLCLPNDVQKPPIEAESNSNFPGTDTLQVPSLKSSSRRKSLQAIISRYRELVASSKAQEPVKMSPPSSPELDLSDEGPKIDLDLNLDHNID